VASAIAIVAARRGIPCGALRVVLDAVDDGIDLDDDLDIAERDARRYGIPYQTVDFVTGRQIEWEREQSQHGPVYRLGLTENAAGKLTLKNLGRGIVPDSRFSFADLAKMALSALFDTIGRVNTLEELRARTLLLQDIMDDPVAYMYRDPEWREELERYLAPDEEIVHSSYEAIDEEGNLLIHHRSRRQAQWETWHHEIDRSSSAPLELGFDLCSDDELESLLGVDAWDEDGTPIVA